MQAAFRRVLKLFQTALNLPVSTASYKRSLSGIKRVKTYTRTTMMVSWVCGLGENDLTRDESLLDIMVKKFKEDADTGILLPRSQDE
jgi:hypothetical protein